MMMVGSMHRTVTLNMNGNTTFIHNSAANGGGTNADHCTVNMNENTTFIQHSAASAGGGIYAYKHTILKMSGMST